MQNHPFNPPGAAPAQPPTQGPEPTPVALVAQKDGDIQQTTDFKYDHLIVYPDPANKGNVWIGGPDVTDGKGIPLKGGPPLAIQMPTTYAYFEKAGDKLYRLDW